MYKKHIYLIAFVVSMSLASLACGGDVLIGNFEGGSMDGWGPTDPCDAILSFSTDGATLDGNSLKITDAIGNSFGRVVTYSMVAANNVEEFRKHTKVSLDLTRLAGDWDGVWGGWNPEHTSFTGWSEFHMVIEAGSTDAELGIWAKGWNLTQIANWGAWQGDSPKKVIYDYSLILNQIDFNNLTYLGIFFATNWGNYDAGGVYYIDNVKLAGEGMAYEPIPADHEVDVLTDSYLSWTPGVGAVSHDVYLGASFNDVNDANRTDPRGVLKSQGQMTNTYDPTLAFYTTYYWRIDEVNGASIQKGTVWDFMTVYTGMGTVIGDYEIGMNGWEATWQGKTTFSYSTNGTTMGNNTLAVQTVKNTEQDPGYWIIKRDGVLDLTNMKLQIDVTLLSPEWQGQTVDIGPVVVQTDLPESWSQYAATAINRKTGLLTSNTWTGGGTSAYRTYTFDFSGPTTAPAYTHTDWADANKMTILLALQNGAQGLGKFYLDNARLVNVRLASNPRPANLATDINTTPLLSWTLGKDATSHDVYFGTDETAVINATTSNPLGVYKGNQADVAINKYVPGLLAKNTTYYWRIDERGAPDSPWKGLLWHFTTAEYVFVEDYEIYNNTSNRIYNTWIQGGGGKVGYDACDFAEVTIIHGGLQSMPFDYNNIGSPYDSNAARTFTTYQDWTAENVKSLEFWYRGWPVSVGSFTGAGPYTITAAGEDVWDVPDLRGISYHDEFHYAYKEITGTAGPMVTIIARVDSVSNSHPWAKAGIMIRQSLDPNSKNGFMCITPEMGAAFQFRADDGGFSTSYDYQMSGYEFMADINAPYWLKIEMYTDTGDMWAYYSANGTSWTPLITDSPILPNLPIYVGLAVTAHNSAAICTTGFSNVSITAPGMTISSWNHQDVGIKSNVAAPLYVTLQDDATVGSDTATITHSDPNMVLQKTWQAWDIALNDFKVINPNLNLEKIKKITLGVGHRTTDPCGTGTLYFDDIRLYPPRCLAGTVPDLTGDCFVGYDDLQILTDGWLSSPADPDIDMNDDNQVNFKDYAVLASKWLESVLWP